jgi:N-acetylglucosamine kinase-like BadF-type ATPase
VTIVVGVDGGGTKTHVAVANEAGELLGFSANGASNWEMVGLVGAATAITRAVQTAIAEADITPDDVDAAVFGLAGVDWPSDEERLMPLITRLRLRGPRIVLNDSLIALRAGTARSWGVVIISGTGAVAAGRNQAGETFRTLGLGWEFGDWGSASDIVQEALRGVANAYTGRGPETTLTATLCAYAGASTAADLLERASRGTPGFSYEDYEDPRVAPLVIRDAERGDAVARDILYRAGTSLGDAAALVANRLSMEQDPFHVVLAGGLFRNESRLVDEAIEVAVRRVAHRASLIRLDTAPVVGALLSALEMAGARTDPEVRSRLSRAVRERLIATTEGHGRVARAAGGGEP